MQKCLSIESRTGGKSPIQKKKKGKMKTVPKFKSMAKDLMALVV